MKRRRKRSKPLYYCVVMPTRHASESLGAVYGCSTKQAVALAHLERAIDRGASGLRIRSTFFPPRGYGKWLTPAH